MGKQIKSSSSDAIKQKIEKAQAKVIKARAFGDVRKALFRRNAYFHYFPV